MGLLYDIPFCLIFFNSNLICNSPANDDVVNKATKQNDSWTLTLTDIFMQSKYSTSPS